MFAQRFIYLCFASLVLLFVLPTISMAQEANSGLPEFLQGQGLTKAQEGDLQGQQIMLDGISIPVYTQEGEKLEGMAIMQLMMKGEMIPEIFVDGEKEIKAFVMRPMTEEEKKRMQMRMKDMGNMNMGNDRVGEQGEAFTAADLKGNNYSLAELKGKVVVMNFWFIACKPCVMEMPELNELVEKYKGKEVVFLGFAVDKTNRLEPFLEKQEFHYQIIPDSREVIGSYKVSVFPTHIILDKEGKIAFETAGLGPMTIDQLDQTIAGQLGDEE